MGCTRCQVISMVHIRPHEGAFDRLFNRSVRCGACRRSRETAGRLVDGPWVYICESCLRETNSTAAIPRWPTRCSFCGDRHQSFAGAWPGIAICADCAQFARGILAEGDSPRADIA